MQAAPRATFAALKSTRTVIVARFILFLMIPAGIIYYAMGGFGLAHAQFHLHWPRWSLLAAASPVIRLHVAAAVVALLIGGVVLARVKGTTWHKRLGWVWVIAMAIVALSSIFIRVLNPGHFSLIHTLTGIVVISLPLGIIAIRQRNVRRHRMIMVRLYTAGMILAGALTFLPGRLMFRVFFG